MKAIRSRRLLALPAFLAGFLSLSITSTAAGGTALCEIEAGAVMARYTREFDPPGYDFPARIGAHFGFGLVAPVTDQLAIRSGLAYERKGAKAEGDLKAFDGSSNEDGWTHHSSDRLDYMVLSVALRATQQGRVRPYIVVGPEVAFLVSSRQHSVLERGAHREIRDRSLDSTTRSIDVGLSMGAGLRTAHEPCLYGELRYVHGLLDITEGPYHTSNRAFVGLLGVAF
ncbi:MAG: PorT family protein [Planctomycetaceae bacterium]|nr:MAG: PorT family protein [Planctomycetaceae bacterium]